MKHLKIKFIAMLIVLLASTSCKKEKVNPTCDNPLVFIANVTQIDQQPPTFKVLENTIGDIQWEYTIKGFYRGILPVSYNVEDVWVSINKQTLNGDTAPTIRIESNWVTIESFHLGEHEDNILVNVPIEIKVYD